MHTQPRERGITLLITLLLMGVLLGVSASLLNITLKQYQLSGIALSSEIAFQAANAGLECILYHDFPATGDSPFAVNANGTPIAEENGVPCMGGTSEDVGPNNGGLNTVVSGEEQRFEFSWPQATPTACSSVSIYKFSEGTALDANDVGPLVIVDDVNRRKDVVNNASGAGAPDGIGDPCPEGSVCTVVQARGYNVPCSQVNTNPRVVEREYTQVY